MKIVLAGCTGFIGRRLVPLLVEEGHQCTVLIRSYSSSGPSVFPDSVRLAPYSDMPDEAEAVVNLAGESVAGLWTKSRKAQILQSRVKTTDKLVEWMDGLAVRPSVFLSASAVGIYGDRRDERLTEKSVPDPDNCFLCQVCKSWEEEARRASSLGIRVVTARTGNVLDGTGGMLGKLLPLLRLSPFIVSLAGDAYFPWISLRDEVGAIAYALKSDWVEGPVNLVSPNPMKASEFYNALGRRTGRPVIGNLPSWALRILSGEFADALLASQRILPEKLQNAGFVFEDTDIEEYFKGNEF